MYENAAERSERVAHHRRRQSPLLPDYWSIGMAFRGASQVSRSNATVNDTLGVLSRVLTCSPEWGVIAAPPRFSKVKAQQARPGRERLHHVYIGKRPHRDSNARSHFHSNPA